MQLAEKAIRDRLTRILVITGACAGLCYNALWFFPVLILIGGIAAVVWDVWMQRSVSRMRANWMSKKRRARSQDGDVEEIRSSQSIPLEGHAQATSANLTQRKPQAEGPERHSLTEHDSAGQGSPANGSVRAGAGSIEAAPISDTKTHNISVKLGISLIIGFLGTLSSCSPVHC
jgi:hypothetical protein